MINYKTLDNTDMTMLHQTFLDAFSDYQVKMELPLWKLQQMLQRRGYVPEVSIGAFKDDALKGFVFNGFRNWKGKSTAYDSGTGVVPEYRKQGITTSMFHKALEMLKEKGAEQYLLEVIQTNAAAFDLYKKQGFQIVRTFSCFQLDKNKYKPTASCKVQHVESIDSIDWEQFASFWEIEPSWQNSIDSVKAVSDEFACTVACIDGSIVGYGLIEKKTGDIPQLAVRQDFRRKGIGSSILADLLKNTERDKISVINVDDKSKTMKEFLRKMGFEHHVDQYEMILDL